MSYYQNNLQIIEKRHRDIYRLIKDYENNKLLIKEYPDSSKMVAEIIDKDHKFKIYIEPTRTDIYTMRVKNEEGELYFHSRYNPEREAEKVVKNYGFSGRKQIVVLGAGLGYYLNEFDSNTKFDAILIIEPFLSIFYAALYFNDLSSFLDNKNIYFIIGKTDSLFELIQRKLTISLEKELDFLEHSPSLKLFNSQYKKVYKDIKEAINYKKVGMISDIAQTRKWRNNIILNLPHIFESPKADDFFGLFQGIPAICVSAGPSLDKNIELLKEVKEKALLICVGTALKALLKQNVEPDIVVSMDGNAANYRHFEGVSCSPDTFLLAELANYYKINQTWMGKQVFFTMKRNFSGWVENLKGNYTSINTGGTVAHSMVDLAYRFGNDPIVLVGQDLAFKEDQTHASGTTYEGRKKDSKGLIEVEGIDGGTVLTDKPFQAMLTFFSDYISKRPDRLFIDATEGGALIKHTDVMKLKEVIAQYCNKNKNICEILREKFNEVKPDFKQIKEELEDELVVTLDNLKEGIEVAKEQLSTILNVEEELKTSKNLSEEELIKLEKSVSAYENKLKGLKYIPYFVERILIAEAMKLNESKSNYYLDKKQSLKERMKYYRSLRIKFFTELEKSRALLEKVYLDNNGDVKINRRKNGELAGEELF